MRWPIGANKCVQDAINHACPPGQFLNYSAFQTIDAAAAFLSGVFEEHGYNNGAGGPFGDWQLWAWGN